MCGLCDKSPMRAAMITTDKPHSPTKFAAVCPAAWDYAHKACRKVSPNLFGFQQLPCFVGKLSPHKTEVAPSVLRGSYILGHEH